MSNYGARNLENETNHSVMEAFVWEEANPPAFAVPPPPPASSLWTRAREIFGCGAWNGGKPTHKLVYDLTTFQDHSIERPPRDSNGDLNHPLSDTTPFSENEWTHGRTEPNLSPPDPESNLSDISKVLFPPEENEWHATSSRTDKRFHVKVHVENGEHVIASLHDTVPLCPYSKHQIGNS